VIDRYSRPEMKNLWSDESRFTTWLEVELAVLKVLEKDKVVPARTASKIKGAAKIKVSRILELEQTLKHDVIAFTTSISEQCGDAGRFFHYGLTSSDVVDTALSILLRRALISLRGSTVSLRETMIALALKHKDLPCIGRTHGVHAEPTSFGLKFLGWVSEFQRHILRLDDAIKEISVGKLSGAVGSFGALSPSVEERALASLGLQPESIATQVLPRDRHAHVFNVIANVGSSLERVAVELRHLQRTEVHELEEEFSAGQKGSSAMPHKKNPISAENLSGCARILRSYAVATSENVALWHERDISHSSVERIVCPDATILLDYMLARMNKLLGGVRVMRENVQKNLSKTQGIYFSGHILLRMVEKGMSREDAYKIVQRCAHNAWDQSTWFGDELWKEQAVQELFSQAELNRSLNIKNYLENVDTLYRRVLGNAYRRSGKAKSVRKKKRS